MIVHGKRSATAALGTMVLAAALGACASGEPAGAAAFVRDSAGVQVIENSAPAWSDAEALRLAAEPSLVIGSADGDETQQLFRVQGVHRFADGGIVVANAGSSELRLYDTAGGFVHAAGGEGGGPGEFTNIFWMSVAAGDSLFVYDLRAGRFSVFGGSVDFVRSFAPAAAGRPMLVQPVGLLNDGSVLVTQRSREAGPPPNGLIRDTVAFARLTREGVLRDTLVRLPGSERFVHVSPTTVEVFIPAFAYRPVVAVDADGFYYVGDEGYEVARYGSDGRLTRLIRLATPARPVTPDEVDAAIQRSAENIQDPAARQRFTERQREIPVPERMPAAGRALVDPARRVWVMDFLGPRDSAATWRAFDAEGRYLGAVAMPRRLTVHQIGADYVLGVFRDESDVEQVRLYPLTPGAGDG